MSNFNADSSKIIERLNKILEIAHVRSDNLDNWGLNEDEKAFVKMSRPENSFVVYGTLAPGRSNHRVVEGIAGKWMTATIRGSLENKGWGAQLGYFGFKHASMEDARDINSFVLISDELVSHWKRLDDFEGMGYKRILVEYELTTGEKGVGFIYAIN
ncbi:MAG: gamma-glutamylcyclotransferase family protein [Cytophagales bacterium]